jgi:hypothetical protein
MSSKVKVLRSTVAGKRPTGHEFGELWVNDKDKVMGYIDSGGQPVVPFALPSDIVIHNFSATTAYKAGDVVLGPDHNLWIAKAAIPAGAWDSTKWDQSGDSRFVNVSGDTMTGALNLPSVEPTGNNAVSRAEGDKLYVNVTGDTMKGALNLPADGLVAGTDQLVIKGGKVGIGTANPTVSKVVIEGNATTPNVFNALTLNNASGGGVALIFDNSISAPLGSIEALVASTGAGGAAADCDMTFGVAQAGINKERLRLKSDGSLYVHVTKRQPWSPASTTIQVGEYSKFGQDDDQFLTVASGGYEYAAKKWKYMLPSNPALMYQQHNGGHHFYAAPGGAADSEVTWSHKMVIAQNGSVGIGTQTPTGAAGTTLAINGGTGQTRIALKNTTTGDQPNDGFQIVLDGTGAMLENREHGSISLATGDVPHVLLRPTGELSVGPKNAEPQRLTLSGIATANGANGINIFESGNGTLGSRLIIHQMEQLAVYNATYSNPSNGHSFQIGNTEVARFSTPGDFRITGATATKASGTTWANPSDIRLKDNIQPFAKGLNELLKVDVKTWEYNGKGGTVAGTKGLGVIADEVMQVLPDTVNTYSAKLNPDDEEEIDIKRFDATEITWLLVNSIKEQQALITDLQTRLAALEAKP